MESFSLDITSSSQRSYIRNLEDTKVMVKYAKLEEDELKPLHQAIYFSNESENYKLMEMNPLIMGSLTEGQRVSFKGNRDDRVVLCTEDKTFEVKEAETSNSLLLVPTLKYAGDCKNSYDNDFNPLEEREIVGVFHTYLELRVITPRLRRLNTLLEPSSYKGPELESELRDSGVKLYTFDSLLDEVQASKAELIEGLAELGTCSIEGYVRLLEFDYHFRVLSYFLNLIDSNSWNVVCIPYRETVENLQELVPPFILEFIFSTYLEMSGERDDEGEPYYSIKEDKLCRFLAEVLLRPAGRFNLQEFLQAWQDSVPEGLQTDLKQLEATAMIDTNAKPQVIWYFPESHLPEDIQERINTLFQVREKWTLEQICPFIEWCRRVLMLTDIIHIVPQDFISFTTGDKCRLALCFVCGYGKLTADKQNVNSLLTKYTRVSNIAGTRYYCAKHGK